MNLLQIITTIFDIVWLSSVLLLLWRIWRNSTQHIHKMETTLLEVAVRNAESAAQSADSARKAVETTQSMAESTHALITIIQAEKRESLE